MVQRRSNLPLDAISGDGMLAKFAADRNPEARRYGVGSSTTPGSEHQKIAPPTNSLLVNGLEVAPVS